ncbi:MAG TPA: helix-turn-helix domain-containing protein, partial [Dehalococcoidia bacterium]|nr:helix-turn-helix domain-containing protein [Dehalococcoidia bacterium]
MTREISRHSEIGELLRSQREERGLTLEQAEEVTRIRRRYLEALESGNFAELPGEVYVRGFLRLYAEYLGLDPGAVLAAYTPARRPTQADLIRPPRLDRTHESIGGRLLAIALVALVAVAAFYLYQQQTAGAPSSTGGSSAGIAPSAAGSPAAVAAVTETPQTPTPTPTPTITPTATATPLPSRVMVRVDALGPVGVDAWVD